MNSQKVEILSKGAQGALDLLLWCFFGIVMKHLQIWPSPKARLLGLMHSFVMVGRKHRLFLMICSRAVII